MRSASPAPTTRPSATRRSCRHHEQQQPERGGPRRARAWRRLEETLCKTTPCWAARPHPWVRQPPLFYNSGRARAQRDQRFPSVPPRRAHGRGSARRLSGDGADEPRVAAGAGHLRGVARLWGRERVAGRRFRAFAGGAAGGRRSRAARRRRAPRPATTAAAGTRTASGTSRAARRRSAV